MENVWKWFDNVFGWVVIVGIVDVIKDVIWDLIFGLLFGFVIGELVMLGYWCFYIFIGMFGFNNYNVWFSNVLVDIFLDVWLFVFKVFFKWC